MPPTLDPKRRPLAARERGWAKALARGLNSARISPDAISITSLVFAVGAAGALWASGRSGGVARILELLAAAALIQLRLLCNMLDGLVAVEGGHQTPHGELFNDMPDRFADFAILVGAGYSLTAFTWGSALGWIAGALAVLTAYTRVLGASMGARHYFLGPMAKPQRMAVMTIACVLSAFEPLLGWRGQIVALALALVAAGSLVTLIRRTLRIVAEVDSR
jgi:phosphatidylglycerophosphate synthase